MPLLVNEINARQRITRARPGPQWRQIIYEVGVDFHKNIGEITRQNMYLLEFELTRIYTVCVPS